MVHRHKIDDPGIFKFISLFAKSYIFLLKFIISLLQKGVAIFHGQGPFPNIPIFKLRKLNNFFPIVFFFKMLQKFNLVVKRSENNKNNILSHSVITKLAV